MTEISIKADFLNGEETAVMSTWYYEDGTHVKQGDIIGELMMEKTQMELEAPASGILKIRAVEDEEVSKDNILATLE